MIFDGEIARASGDIIGSVDTFGDVSRQVFFFYSRELFRVFEKNTTFFFLQTILFTTDEEILESISRNDETFLSVEEKFGGSLEREVERPITGATDISVSFFLGKTFNLQVS